ncbi:MAG TPA: hypothetical protein VIH69_05200 [Dehalococcoidia bacterium]
MNKKRCLVIMAVAVLLLASSCTVNYRPIITSLEAEPDYWTAPLGSLQVTCTASDPEGDELNYNWSAGGGNISGTGAVVNWIAPEEVGMYDITVVVSDTLDKNATGLIALVASNGSPPVIDDLIVTAIGHPYLKKTTTGYKVGKTYDYAIECIASGTGELVYEWSCTGGNISGEGSLITWTAPNTEGDITVTVKVFDDVDNWVRKSIAFEVVPCVSCQIW